MSGIEMVPGTTCGERIPSRLACSYERSDLGWDKPLQIYVAKDRDMVTIIFPRSRRLHKGGGTAHYSGRDGLLRAKRHMEQFTLECQPAPKWEKPIPTMDGFPRNVRMPGGTALPMTAPPEKETRIGYSSWCSNEFDGEKDITVNYTDDHYVLPDGGAKIVHWHNDEVVKEEVLAPGTWEVEYPSTNSGSCGGVCVRRRPRHRVVA